MHLPDLSLLRYHPGPLDAGSWPCPLLSVGWYEVIEELPIGAAPSDLSDRLQILFAEVRQHYPAYHFRGLHQCTLCEPGATFVENAPYSSNLNLLVPGEGVVYAAPGLIVHYLTAHRYLPPSEFIAAVMACPLPGTDAYHAALDAANGGLSSPLKSKAQLDAEQSAFMDQILKRPGI